MMNDEFRMMVMINMMTMMMVVVVLVKMMITKICLNSSQEDAKVSGKGCRRH